MDLGHPDAWADFRGELAAATIANLTHPLMTSWTSALDAMAWLRLHLPYRFVPSLPVASLWQCIPRRWGACGEAAAAIAAWARRHSRSVVWCLERRPDLDPRYAHVVAVVDGRPFDVYAEASRPSSGCAFRWAPP